MIQKMRMPIKRKKQILWMFFVLSLLGGGCHLLLSVLCNIILCSSSENKTIAFSYADDILDKEMKAICSLLILTDKPNTFTVEHSPQLGKNGSYLVVYNYIKSEKNYKGNDSITYSTHATANFLNHIKELASRWNGPISVSVFVPGHDFCSCMIQILRFRQCGGPYLRENVSWHIYWPEKYSPSVDWWKLEEKNFYTNCSVEPLLPLKTWHSLKGLQYPVNVGRNVARKAAGTWFVLPSDIELYPSKNLPQEFMSFLRNEDFAKMSIIKKAWPRIYVIPVFEVQSKIPDNKEELLSQISKGQAVYFHRYVCVHCQNFPGLNFWLQKYGREGQIHAFSSVKRHFPYHRWEPIYIGTNNDPLYDERLSWEGFQDKMSQMHELCLRNYSLIILDRAFLIHSPGIKVKEKGENPGNWRKDFIQENSKTYDIIMNELQAKLGSNVNCRKQ